MTDSSNIKTILCLVICLASFPITTQALASSEDSPPDSRLLPNAKAYQTMDEAAVAALRISASHSTSLEYGGCIFTDGTKFFHTDPASSGKEDNFEVACLALPSMTFVGIFHTHPGIGYAEGVSGPDLVVANQMKKTSYVGLLARNQVIKYIPGKTETQCSSSGSSYCGLKNRTSRGELVDSHLIQKSDSGSPEQATAQAIKVLQDVKQGPSPYPQTQIEDQSNHSAQVCNSRAQKTIRVNCPASNTESTPSSVARPFGS
jgi:hypothetical protein